jgi:hypothetical protein
VLSLDSLLSSAGGVVVQPVFGKVADVWSYQACWVLSAVVQAVAPPFIRLTGREKVDADLVASL